MSKLSYKQFSVPTSNFRLNLKRICSLSLSGRYVAYRTMKETPFKYHVLHFLFFLTYNLYAGITGIQGGSFYGIIGGLLTFGLMYGLTLLSSHLLSKLFKIKELWISLITSFILLTVFVIMSGPNYLAQSAVIAGLYFLIFELTRLGLLSTKKMTLRAAIDLISGLLPFVILFHFTLLGIGLLGELPTAHDKFNYLIFGMYKELVLLAFGVPILSVVCYIHLQTSNLRTVVTRSHSVLVLISTLLAISTSSYIAIIRSAGRTQLANSYIQYDRGEFNLVTSTTSKILRDDPYNSNARFLMACSQIEQEEFQKARDNLSEIIMNPNTGRLTDEQKSGISELTPEQVSKLSQTVLVRDK